MVQEGIGIFPLLPSIKPGYGLIGYSRLGYSEKKKKKKGGVMCGLGKSRVEDRIW